jgi:GxxExxY protein
MQTIDDSKATFGDDSSDVISSCIEVHRHVGPGLLESVYEELLAHELKLRGIHVERQRALPLVYKGLQVSQAHKIDLVVERRLIIELKSVERLLPVHEAQVITYLKLTGLGTGLLINFNVPVLKLGIRRLANRTPSRQTWGD